MRQYLSAFPLLFVLAAKPVVGADLIQDGQLETSLLAQQCLPDIRGRASVISGDTLWLPEHRLQVRLAGIDACPLAQWAFDPARRSDAAGLAPVPCGPLARGWLKRQIGSAVISCRSVLRHPVRGLTARCSARGRDLSLAMLKAGWARTEGQPDPQYLAAERYARSVRYGIWGTYVLDMDEWRASAVDRTLTRRPAADLNLLAERKEEFTPPFADWRNRPPRTDR